ncbi:hypothetical protein KL86DYS1_31589 [uncultured Dysgonomonas sp.]|uniref:Uncharacterized protein n=1 Tax=uncultured Dysgonomonas sp. TaxID=206096 RepID=A0A212K6A8_9BACT|nr:hypothetical protein KL86DYS1_31589 [uncultured Dysgonomonas sp.]
MKPEVRFLYINVIKYENLLKIIKVNTLIFNSIINCFNELF